MSGRIVDVGAGTSAPPRGALVTADSLLPCRDCEMCVPDPNCCPEARLLGFQVPGAFAEFTVVPATSIHSLDHLLPVFGEATARVGCVAEPLGVAAKAVAELEKHLLPGMPRSLLVLGGGPLGVMVAAIGRIQGWQPVVIAEPSALRRRRAATFADAAIDLPTLDDPIEMRRAFGPGPAAVVDACGAADSESFLLPRPRGVYLLLARTGRRRELPEDPIITREITVAGCRGHVRHVPSVLQLMAEGRLDPDAFVTRCLDGLEEVAQWLAAPSRFESELKVVARVASGSAGRPR